jgi:hypothetical protein
VIVREICNEQYTEMIFEKFDYFNDFTNTSMFVQHMIREAKTPEDKERFEGILKRLEDGNEKFTKAFWKR